MPPRIQNESSFEENSMTTAAGSFKGNFRHSSRERKNILKKPKVVNKVKAAPFLDRKSSTYLLYVGNVAIETNEKAIRDHLCDIGVKCDDIADILALNSKNPHYASFCISLNTAEAEETALGAYKWPSGIKVPRFYRQVKSSGGSSGKFIFKNDNNASSPQIRSSSSRTNFQARDSGKTIPIQTFGQKMLESRKLGLLDNSSGYCGYPRKLHGHFLYEHFPSWITGNQRRRLSHLRADYPNKLPVAQYENNHRIGWHDRCM